MQVKTQLYTPAVLFVCVRKEVFLGSDKCVLRSKPIRLTSNRNLPASVMLHVATRHSGLTVACRLCTRNTVSYSTRIMNIFFSLVFFSFLPRDSLALGCIRSTKPRNPTVGLKALLHQHFCRREILNNVIVESNIMTCVVEEYKNPMNGVT
jgi:hypothetical protein